MKKTPALLVIMDGFGFADGNPDCLSDSEPVGERDLSGNGNLSPRIGDSAGKHWTFDAVRAAKTPCLDRLSREYALTVLSASGNDAGFPAGQPGNGPGGCLNIGAGRVVYQDLVRISRAIADGSFYQNPVLIQAMDRCLEKPSALHLAGVLSDTGAYAHIGHLFALLKMAKQRGTRDVYLHLILEGQDLNLCRELLRRVLDLCRELGVGKIATLMGRSFVEDSGHADMLEAAYDAMVYGECAAANPDPEAALLSPDGRTGENLDPVVCAPDSAISDHDSLIFWGFKPLKNLARAFTDPDFDIFTRQVFPLTCVSATDYGVPGAIAAFPPAIIHNSLGEYLSHLGMTQLRVADSARFSEISYYFNGCNHHVFPGEDQISVPASSAPDICAECVRHMESGVYDFIVLGLPDCGKAVLSGSPDAVIHAVETVDTCIGMVAEAALKLGGVAMITASCGGAEEIRVNHHGSDGTTNPVPFLLCGAGSELRSGGRLADIAPTLLDLMGLACPPEMDGKTLIVE